jgi:hypothetical protein
VNLVLVTVFGCNGFSFPAVPFTQKTAVLSVVPDHMFSAAHQANKRDQQDSRRMRDFLSTPPPLPLHDVVFRLELRLPNQTDRLSTFRLRLGQF